MPAVIENRQRRVRVPVGHLRRAAARALAAVGRPGGLVDITVVDDDGIRALNAAFRGIRRRTDVLAFPLETPDAAGGLVGQIVVSAEMAVRQAARVGVSPRLELELLVTHGVLHLVGYDDRDPVEASLMHRREQAILSHAGRRPPPRLWSGLLRTAEPVNPHTSRRPRSLRKRVSARRSLRGLRPRNPALGGGRKERAGDSRRATTVGRGAKPPSER